jgi:serine/threonine-protein kinase
MSGDESNRNLLVGILGLQLGLIKESQLVAALKEWVQDKSRPLEAVLEEQGALTRDQIEFVKGLAEQHLRIHGDRAFVSGVAVSSITTLRLRLAEIGQRELSEWIERLQSGDGPEDSGVDLEQTVAIPQSVHSASAQRFRILRPHAKGGLGQVSIAEDRELHREVALKELRPQFQNDATSRQRFLLEAEVTGRLEHPGIVPVYSLGSTPGGNPFYAMRFIRGHSLRTAIDQLYETRPRMSVSTYRMELRRLVQRLIDVCDAIEYAHSRRVLHRDLKPGNIMLGRYGETLVVDWGLAKTGTGSGRESNEDEPTVQPISTDGSTETQMGSVVGTLAYMSPEQANGRIDQLGPTSDVYSLGATLYSILTGEPPVSKLSKEETLDRVRSGNYPPPRERNPQAPAALDAICRKAMSLRQSDRYASAAELASELELWLADEPVKAYREPWFDRLARLIKRYRTVAAAGVAFLATATIALFGLNMVIRAQNRDLKIARDDAAKQRDTAHKATMVAEDNRNKALAEKKRAVDNLATARGLSLVLLRTAEERLTNPSIDARQIQELRKSLTEKSFESFRAIHEQSHDDPAVNWEFSQILRISSNLKRLERDLKVADERLRQSLELQLSAPEESRTLEQQDYLAETYREVGVLRRIEGKLAESDAALNESLRLAEKLIAAHPEASAYRRTKAVVELEQSGIAQEKLDLTTSLEKAVSSAAALEALRAGPGAMSQDDFLLLFAMLRRIESLKHLGRREEVELVSQAAIATGRAIRIVRSGDSNVTLPYCRILACSAESLLNSSPESVDAADRLKEATTVLEALVASVPRASYMAALAETLRQDAFRLRLQSRLTEAEQRLIQAGEIIDKLVRASRSADHLHLLVRNMADLSKTKVAAGDVAAAKELLQKAILLQEEACRLVAESLFERQKLETYKSALEALM